jgi:aspartyl-tRNA(Asn)/glutamyl-tRNA(Gln) amidotransferase subunit C
MARTAVTVETVDHVSRLAHLSLTDEERETFTRQLAQVLEYAEALQALDTSDVAPMSHAGTSGEFRADVPGESLEREKALDAAPDPADGLFRVPKVLGG